MTAKKKKTVKKKEQRLSQSAQAKRVRAKAGEDKALAQYGRPRLYLTAKDVKNIELLASICVSQKDIATIVGMDVDTLKSHFSAPIKKGRANMRAKLMKSTFDSALKGNVTAQIWLGKQDAIGLNFTDKMRTEATGKDGGPIQYDTANTGMLWGILDEAAKQGRLTKEQMARIGYHQQDAAPS